MLFSSYLVLSSLAEILTVLESGAENFLLGQPHTAHEKRLYLVDLGLGKLANCRSFEPLHCVFKGNLFE